MLFNSLTFAANALPNHLPDTHFTDANDAPLAEAFGLLIAERTGS